ncbi:MAG: hypothetical protein NTZ74_04700 [Chloroflexi bacterium]|nr:hypothetical protein [Chloroflexota bacterium]
MKKADHTKDILEVFLIQGMATSAQIRRHIDLSEDQVQYGLRKLTNKVNASFWTTNIRRPWEIEGSGRPEKVFVLTEEGAKELHNNSGLYVSVPSRENTTKNMLHSLALVDIANYCFKKNMECTANKQVNLADSDEYTRPDIIYKTPDGREHFVEFEQTRYKYTLNIKLLTRMKKWQEILTSSKAQQYSNDIFVLFWTEKEDGQTLAAWMSALDDLCKQLTEAPAFNVWYMNFSDFYQNPSFEKKQYKKLIPSNNPEEGLLKSERENSLKKKKGLYLKHLDSDAAEDELIDFVVTILEKFPKFTETTTDRNFFQTDAVLI